MNKLSLLLLLSITAHVTHTMEITKSDEDDWVMIDNAPKTNEAAITRPKRVNAAELKRILLEKEKEIQDLIKQEEKSKEDYKNQTQELSAAQQKIADLLLANESQTKEIIRLSSVAQIVESMRNKPEQPSKYKRLKNSITKVFSCCLPAMGNTQFDQDLVTLEEKKQ